MAKKAQADHRADTRGGGWNGIPHCVIDSAAYRDLSLTGRAVLTEIVRAFNGYNNGKIVLSQRQIAKALKTSSFRKIVKALAELMSHGFIDLSAEGIWKERQAREYRLTFVSTSGRGSQGLASNDYANWRADDQSGADEASATGVGSAAKASSAAREFDEAAVTRISAHRGKTAAKSKAADDEASSLITKPYPAAKTRAAAEHRTQPLDAMSDKDPVRPATGGQDPTVEEVAVLVRADLVACQKRFGLGALTALALQAGVDRQRVRLFADGFDGLEAATIFRLRRELNTFNGRQPALQSERPSWPTGRQGDPQGLPH